MALSIGGLVGIVKNRPQIPRAFKCHCEGRSPKQSHWRKKRLLRFARNDSEDNRKTLDNLAAKASIWIPIVHLGPDTGHSKQ